MVSIPGNVGSAPIQNIGAYGKEIKDVIENCRGVFTENGSIKIFSNEECCFSYRSSIFKEDLKNKFIISNVTLRLTKKNHKINSEYSDLKNDLIENGIKTPTIKNIAESVSKIRSDKLPDYKKIGNAGSFFKNPIIDSLKFKKIKKLYPNIISYDIGISRFKIPAGWLIERCGFKDIKKKKVSVYKKQALVIINLGDAKGIDIFNFSQKIKKTVNEKFDILLEEEVNII
jgi:UDP-N-acetylmuramate dehydrogenase